MSKLARVAPEPGSAILPRMASVLWLDFEGVVVEAGLTDAIVGEYAAQPPAAGTQGDEAALAAALGQFEAPREEVESRVREVARIRPGFEELVGWAQWHGWLPIVVSTAPDVCVETVLDEPGFDRIARHCGRTRQVYRWRLTYASPRGVELEEGFLLSYAAALRDAGDLVVYVGAQDAGGEGRAPGLRALRERAPARGAGGGRGHLRVRDARGRAGRPGAGRGRVAGGLRRGGAGGVAREGAQGYRSQDMMTRSRWLPSRSITQPSSVAW